MRLDDVVTILEGMPSIKTVINDGQLLDRQQYDRNIANVPYIEIIEDDIDFEDHSSSARNRQVSAQGRIIVFKQFDNIKIKSLLAEMETVIVKNAADELHFSITSEPESFTERLYRIDFTVEYFATAAKVA